jgi:hypothetical protein
MIHGHCQLLWARPFFMGTHWNEESSKTLSQSNGISNGSPYNVPSSQQGGVGAIRLQAVIRAVAAAQKLPPLGLNRPDKKKLRLEFLKQHKKPRKKNR